MDCDLRRSSVFGVNPTVHPICDAPLLYGGRQQGEKDLLSLEFIWNQASPNRPSLDLLYFVKSNSGLLSCFNAKTGEAYYGPQRLEGLEGVYSSPVGAGDRVYLASQNGTTIVIRRGPQFEVLATNTLEDGFDASPAVAGKEIYLRGRRFLYCVATDRDGP
jgi:outer membrane protein assembly factor BamB